jgi:hypothetical protein
MTEAQRKIHTAITSQLLDENKLYERVKDFTAYKYVADVIEKVLSRIDIPEKEEEETECSMENLAFVHRFVTASLIKQRLFPGLGQEVSQAVFNAVKELNFPGVVTKR